MPEPKIILAEPLRTCSLEPCIGVARCGNCETGPQAISSHTVDLKRHAADLS